MTTRVAAAIFFCAMVTTPGYAQTSQNAFAGVVVSAMTIEDGTSASITGGIGYQLNSIVGLGFDLTFVPRLKPDVPDVLEVQPLLGDVMGFPYPSPTVHYEADGGHATIFTANVRLTIPTRARHVSPYLVGGAGVATIRDNFLYTSFYPPLIPAATGSFSIIIVPALPIVLTATGFAATLGGGLAILTNDHWSVDVDGRYVSVFGNRDLQIGRYGGGVTYHF